MNCYNIDTKQLGVLLGTRLMFTVDAHICLVLEVRPSLVPRRSFPQQSITSAQQESSGTYTSFTVIKLEANTLQVYNTLLL